MGLWDRDCDHLSHMGAEREVRKAKDFGRIYKASKCWAHILSYFVGIRGLKRERKMDKMKWPCSSLFSQWELGSLCGFRTWSRVQDFKIFWKMSRWVMRFLRARSRFQRETGKSQDQLPALSELGQIWVLWAPTVALFISVEVPDCRAGNHVKCTDTRLPVE